MTISLSDQVHAINLSSRCTRLLAKDAIWTAHLSEGPDQVSSWDRVDLAEIGQEMAAEITAIHDERDLVQKVLEYFLKDLADHPELLEQLSSAAECQLDADRISQGTLEALRHLESQGPSEVAELKRAADLLVLSQANTPEGDLPRKMWAAISVIAGLLMIGASVPMILLGGRLAWQVVVPS
ncbi:hypothetical protein [Streptomyces lateritius]|uniref:hypothetical protein n=1 Tax=Streptomyces lateritius TaxID=67313 RepID=UPI001C8BBD49|nr:hypothetical protein [Streptomyces lateritius]MBX9427516.1 hypothetical protein [Streptomyces lateritius]